MHILERFKQNISTFDMKKQYVFEVKDTIILVLII